MLVTLILPARSLDFSWTLRTRLMGSCSERASSLPSTFQGKTWSPHRHVASTLRATSSGSMLLRTPWGNCTHMDSSQPETRTRTKTSRLNPEPELCPFIRVADRLGKSQGLVCIARRLGTAWLRLGGILCHAEERLQAAL